MRSRYTVVESDGIYFVTATIVEWLPVFIGTDACGVIVGALDFCRKNKAFRLYAYVIMENHVHLVAESPDLSGVMRALKGYTAREIVRLAEATNRAWLLNQFAYYKKKNKQSSQYQVWQEGFHPQLLQDDAMLRQKIAYIHENPVRRGYVDAPEDWRYSSARNYLRAGHIVLAIDELAL